MPRRRSSSESLTWSWRCILRMALLRWRTWSVRRGQFISSKVMTTLVLAFAVWRAYRRWPTASMWVTSWSPVSKRSSSFGSWTFPSFIDLYCTLGRLLSCWVTFHGVATAPLCVMMGLKDVSYRQCPWTGSVWSVSSMVLIAKGVNFITYVQVTHRWYTPYDFAEHLWGVPPVVTMAISQVSPSTFLPLILPCSDWIMASVS